MSFHRVLVVALATLFSVGMTSLASASCCGWGYSAPVAYAAVTPVGYGGCGTCGAPAPVVYGGCGACGAPTAAAVYAQPVAPAPIAVNPVMPTAFGGPCCSWSGCGNCGWSDWSGGGSAWSGGCGCGPVGYAAPSPYVVNQGPVYSGPAIMAYQTYSPETAYVPATDYPYVPGSGYGYGYGAVPPYAPYYGRAYYRPRFAYRTPYLHRYYGAPRRRYYR